jgi:hypothetical protein
VVEKEVAVEIRFQVHAKIMIGFPLRRCSWLFNPIVPVALTQRMIQWLDAVSSLRVKSSNVLVVPAGEGSIHTLILVANEILRRVAAVTRARRAEDEAASVRKQAMLGRYMLELRDNFNDALTSLLGNAELVLMAPGQLSPEAREQVRTVHMMALRLSEMQTVESQPQGETQTADMKESTAL